MTAVLLIADSQRVQRVFADLESRGVLQLHAAATLDQVDQEMTAALPAFTFVQSGISGLSTGILLRHLKKALPETSKLILLSGDPADLQPGSLLGIPPVDLQTADDMLAETITGIVTGTGRTSPAHAKRGSVANKTQRQEKSAPRKGTKREQADAQEPLRRAKEGKAGASRPQVKAQQAQPAQGGKEAPVSPGAEPVPLTPAARRRAREAQASAVASGTEGAASGSEGFREMLAAASAGKDSDISFPPEVQDQVRIGAGSQGAHPTVHASEVAQSTEPQEPGGIPGAEVLLPAANPGEEAGSGSGKRKKPLWLFLLLSAFFLIPSTAYLAGRVLNAQEQEARLHGDRVAGQRPALTATAASATALNPSRAAAETAPKGASPQEAAHVSGLAAVPPFLEGVEADRRYGDRHPGWERYLGARAEYKLFRQDGRYRAIQAIARGDEIPDQLFRRVLLEFGGIAGYAVRSTEEKGDYLVEQATGSGSASLTIYRKRNDLRIKGVVVYYR